jgi:predicted DNA-binding transcriptional regulator YafY
MDNRRKAENLIRLIGFLSTRKLNIKEIAKLLEVETRQVKVYLDSLEDIAVSVDEDLNGRLFIFGADKLLQGELEATEKSLIRSTLLLHKPNHPLTAGIVNKLKEDQMPLPTLDELAQVRISDNFDKISKAIDHKRRIVLHRYHSPTGKKEHSDRLVEPIAFLDHHRLLKAYEISSRTVKSFKIDRIGEVEITDTPCSKSRKETLKMDPFGFSCEKTEIVKIRLSPLAKDLMSEELPQARPYLTEIKAEWFFIGPICDPKGLGRFILGLPGHTQVINGEALREHLKAAVTKYEF